MKITWSINRQTMIIEHKYDKWSCQVSSVVRNELNSWRPNPKKFPSEEVVHMITWENTESDIPVMPRHFPMGLWNITGVEFRTDRWRKPLVIITDAFQSLEVWSLKPNGGYDKPTGKFVEDFQYYLHASDSQTTQGCGRMERIPDVYRLAAESLIYLNKGEKVLLEVTV